MLHLKAYFTPAEQLNLVNLCRKVCEISPMITPVMPSGHKFNCQMTSCVKIIIPNSSNILKNNGRLNLTIRQVY